MTFGRIGVGGGRIGVKPAAPANTGAPVIAGTPQVGQTLTCTSPGTWSNNPTSFTFVWYWNTDPADVGRTYTCIGIDVGGTMTCRVAASNSGGASGYTPSNGLGPVTA